MSCSDSSNSENDEMKPNSAAQEFEKKLAIFSNQIMNYEQEYKANNTRHQE